MIKDLKVGQDVYAILRSTFAGPSVIKGSIKEFSKNNNGVEYCVLDGQCFVNGNGKDIGIYRGTCGAHFENIFETPDDAFKTLKLKHEKAVKALCDSLNTAEDFIRFAYENCLNGEEYTDYEAREAYIKRAKEVFNIDL